MTDYAIVSHNLTKRFGRKAALDAVSVHVPAGSIYGLIGPNGAGKTTLLRCVLDLYRPTRGTLTVLGHELTRDPVAPRRRIGHVAALQPLWESMRVRELARFMAGCYPRWDQEAVSALLARTRVDPEARLRSLSRGQRIIAALAVQIGHQPELLLLDEALTGLDVMTRREVLRSVIESMHDARRTVVITGHDLGDMERICDHLGVLVEGRLVLEAPIEEVKERTVRLRVRHAPQAEIAAPAGAVTVGRGLGETRFVCRDGGTEALCDLRARGLRTETEELSLEEILVSLAEATVAGAR
jgi:ABC-2 type transport system ATP-binding protein